MERLRARRGDGEHEVEEATVESDNKGNEEFSGLSLNNLRIETAISEVEAEEGLEAALGMEVEGREGEEEGGGTLRALKALEFLTHDAEPSGKKLVDARNGFNELSRFQSFLCLHLTDLRLYP